MSRWTVESTSLVSLAYFADQSVLELEFRDGAAYRFFQVPPECFEQLLAAGSKGAYFNHNIRNHFRYQRISRHPDHLRRKTK